MADPLPPPSDFSTPLARVWEPRDDHQSDVSPVETPAVPRDRIWLHVVLLVVTFVTTTIVGMALYAQYVGDFGYRRVRIGYGAALIGGLWYSVPALLILGSHEMGHYFACRYYRVAASLPYFIPAPPGLTPFGTLGAVIRIRQPLRTKRMLFDVGIAGPIAGFVVLVPALIAGLGWSRIIRRPPLLGGIELGEPMLFQLVSRWFFGTIPDGYILNAHPMAFAALFGLLATALNLLPIGQLDGGHVAYAALGRRAKWVTVGTLLTMAVLAVTVAYSWLTWCLLMLLLLRLTGWEHPPTLDERVPLDRPRLVLTLVAAIIFALCFTPVPVQVSDLLGTGGPPSSQQPSTQQASGR